MGLGYAGPTRGLDPAEVGSPLLEAGSHAGMCASLGSTLWDSVTGHTVLGLLHGGQEQHTPDPEGQLLREDGDSETHKCTFQRGWRSLCVTG